MEGPELRAQAGAWALGSTYSLRVQELHSVGLDYVQLPSSTQILA